jgi:predicted O-methyltransferase YrrM
MSDITKAYIESYLEAIRPMEEDRIMSLELEARKKGIPVIKHDAREMLKFIVCLHQPKRILEVGTAVGFSAITILKTIGKQGRVTTIERNPRMIKEAKKNFDLFGLSSQVTLLEGDSEEILPGISGQFDMIFMDAAKGQYLHFLPECIRLLKDGGILVSDNVLQAGYIAKSRWSIPRRQRTIHARMRDYLWTLNHHPLLHSAILPISDGLTVSVKKEQR